jgi:SAM-dependent methyltransferase
VSRVSFDLVLGGVPRYDGEGPWAWRLARRFAQQAGARRLIEVRQRQPVVADAAGESPVVLAWADPEAYLAAPAAARLLETLDSLPAADLVLPVSNEPWSEELRRAPPFAYSTPSTLAQAAALAAAAAAVPFPLDAPRSPVFAVRRGSLESLAPDLPLEDVPEAVRRSGGRAFGEPRAYLHRYAEMDAQAREDLVARVPAGAHAVLDVGCSRGATAATLRARGVARIVGIEPDAADAAGAASAYDRVIPLPLESVSPEEFGPEFDAVLFGDVLEHLVDPSDALVKVRPWLSSRGVVVASVPNVGNWAVIADLIAGRFDYVPYSILSGTHVRHFTRSTVRDLFEACGYDVVSIDTVELPRSPHDEARLARLASLPGASPDLSVAEFIAVARPAGRET